MVSTYNHPTHHAVLQCSCGDTRAVHDADHVEHEAAVSQGGAARRSRAYGSRTGARGARGEQLCMSIIICARALQQPRRCAGLDGSVHI